ncbi:pyridoxal phosphate-dependent transferase [Elsinoe ampelina]|uniref:Pyridoxal phosphate-dependent transferase n=1 Tax=Elsinoe ampelina TaxID=302913 RepID=A0A6A6G5I9_9PEZI|nr:pyridoxal phosphate-dependent transferase [Elsinoe ampelina]
MVQDLAAQIEASRKSRLQNPLTEGWDGAKLCGILRTLDALKEGWNKAPLLAFSPDYDSTALDVVAAMQETGIFRFNNGILMPEDKPGNWPFHLKDFERRAVVAKGARVGLSPEEVTGYVCGASEAHQYCIRAVRDRILQQAPNAKVTLLSGQRAHSGVGVTAEVLGMPHVRVKCNSSGSMRRDHLDETLRGISSAVIVVVTWANVAGGGYDDARAVAERMEETRRRTCLPVSLHLDASRCFDDVTTMSEAQREELGLPEVRMKDCGPHAVKFDTIAAGGVTLGGMGTELVVALNNQNNVGHGSYVEYIAGHDSTISGSRDALSGAMVALHEEWFVQAKVNSTYDRRRRLRRELMTGLEILGIPLRYDKIGLDVVLGPHPRLPWEILDIWGARLLDDGSAMLTVNSAANEDTVRSLIHSFESNQPPQSHDVDVAKSVARPHVVDIMLERLRKTAERWRLQAVRSCGYPGNHSTLSLLGPVVGHALSSPIPRKWLDDKARALLKDTCTALEVADHSQVRAAFTTGSTASNRVGILTALRKYPHACVYTSQAAHYCVAKIMSDVGRISHLKTIATDALGRIRPEAFAMQLELDQLSAKAKGVPSASILVANYGTTFMGATDDIEALCEASEAVGCSIDHIHLDGALMLGADMSRYTLGPSRKSPRDPDTGRLVVQGISASLHKFPGLSVAGQVVCWKPVNGRLVANDERLQAKHIVEMWIYNQLVSPEQSRMLYDHCLNLARRLRERLEHGGRRLLYNPESIVTVLERPPDWVVERYNLSAQGKWAHFITMPHVSEAVVDEFVAVVSRCTI